MMLRDILRKCDGVVIIGDFNCRLGSDAHNKHANADGRSTDNLETTQDGIGILNLYVKKVHYFSQKYSKRIHTYHHLRRHSRHLPCHKKK